MKARSSLSHKPHTSNKKIFRKELSSALIAVLPAFILYVVFTISPLFLNMIYMLTDWDGMSLVYNFIGFKNFSRIFSQPEFLKVFWNTIYFAVVSICIGTILQLSLAVLMYKNFKGNAIARAIFYMPLVISGVVMALSWRNIFQYTGYINMILNNLGFIKEPIDWLGNQSSAMNVLVFINLLNCLGVGIVIITAGLNSIPKELYEAADIDGSSGFNKFWYVTFPLIIPSMTILWFVGIVGALQVFDLPFLITPSGSLNSTTTLSVLIYNVLFNRNQFGVGSAMGFVFFLFIAFVSIIQLKITRSKEVEL